jgi:hypothetical protein
MKETILYCPDHGVIDKPFWNDQFAQCPVCFNDLEVIRDGEILEKDYNIQKYLAKPDHVSNPSHYANTGKIQPIEFINDHKLNFNRGNVVKYVSRAGHKDPAKEIEDLKKAKQYLEFEINFLETGSVFGKEN